MFARHDRGTTWVEETGEGPSYVLEQQLQTKLKHPRRIGTRDLPIGPGRNRRHRRSPPTRRIAKIHAVERIECLRLKLSADPFPGKHVLEHRSIHIRIPRPAQATPCNIAKRANRRRNKRSRIEILLDLAHPSRPRRIPHLVCIIIPNSRERPVRPAQHCKRKPRLHADDGIRLPIIHQSTLPAVHREVRQQIICRQIKPDLLVKISRPAGAVQVERIRRPGITFRRARSIVDGL